MQSFMEKGFSEADAKRINMTISCRDCDFIPKVANAGEIFSESGREIQLMHNGVKILKDCYYGAWTTEIIRQLKGHHEPQEEAVVHKILDKLHEVTSAPTILELGAFWSFYSLWVLDRFPNGSAFLVEPDPAHLEIGKINFMLNNRQGNFYQAGIGKQTGISDFMCEDGIARQLPIEDLPSLFKKFNLDKLTLLLVDIQGAETNLIESGLDLFKNKKVDLLVISTHHHFISNDPLTHQKCLQMIKDCGGHIIAEHSVAESYSGDGLIAASFHPAFNEVEVEISYARSKQSLFPEIEYELLNANNEIKQQQDEITHLQFHLDQLKTQHQALTNELLSRPPLASKDYIFYTGLRLIKKILIKLKFL